MRAQGHRRWMQHAALRVGDLRDEHHPGARDAGARHRRCCSSASTTRFGFGLFDPARGGDPVLFQHLFWFYSHPAVYIMILPGDGRDQRGGLARSRARTRLRTRRSRYSSLGIAFVGFLTWGHHMFVAGHVARSTPACSACSRCWSAIFSAIKVFTWTARCTAARSRFTTPLALRLRLPVLVRVRRHDGRGGRRRSSLDVHWHDTYFVVAHFHFIMVGGTLTAFLAALHYWFPKMTGRMYSERLGAALGGARVRRASSSRSSRSSCSATRACRGATTTTRRSSRRSTSSRPSAPGCSRSGCSITAGVPRSSRSSAARARRRQPLGLAELRVAHDLAAADAQLRARRPRSRSTPTTTRSRCPARRPRPRQEAA